MSPGARVFIWSIIPQKHNERTISQTWWTVDDQRQLSIYAHYATLNAEMMKFRLLIERLSKRLARPSRRRRWAVLKELYAAADVLLWRLCHSEPESGQNGLQQAFLNDVLHLTSIIIEEEIVLTKKRTHVFGIQIRHVDEPSFSNLLLIKRYPVDITDETPDLLGNRASNYFALSSRSREKSLSAFENDFKTIRRIRQTQDGFAQFESFYRVKTLASGSPEKPPVDWANEFFGLLNKIK